MLARISLIIAILAGLAAGYFIHFEVNRKLVTAIAQRDDFHAKLDKTVAELETTKADLAKTKTDLENTTTELNNTKTMLTDANNKVTQLEGSNQKLTTDLATAVKDKARYQADLKDWNSLRQPFDAVKKSLADLVEAKKELVAVNGEKTILDRRVKKLEHDLAVLTDGEIPPVILPAGLKGRIVQVDPRYDFVVLNIGGNQGVLENGEMLINRHGKLIGKVKIRSVEADSCIANVMPAWKQGDPFEGDEVLY
ncbi:MAG: hypothetical protein HY301_13015 [Verrucomicrobia bacterium]|nr:hypothetical protein [Verrucomicrobiota bacterium]